MGAPRPPIPRSRPPRGAWHLLQCPFPPRSCGEAAAHHAHVGIARSASDQVLPPRAVLPRLQLRGGQAAETLRGPPGRKLVAALGPAACAGGLLRFHDPGHDPGLCLLDRGAQLLSGEIALNLLPRGAHCRCCRVRRRIGLTVAVPVFRRKVQTPPRPVGGNPAHSPDLPLPRCRRCCQSKHFLGQAGAWPGPSALGERDKWPGRDMRL